ncbi:helix-hairpin-helix domain-containing protein [Staphylococcus americanisciuri]|uniref:Helix-hairpin-helix domain-containing protein n=1 Tax=Staphylococcus americanisciuri TaxID=2973940 RepID=A0ABT2EZD2_9STAP|nr:helix-hairpin-helix domain-containing protein [Staphylococcus americanisciuri]MCS4485574.1 helix-hairpin-helix domain-containing protein [Staphylococcus americanisciuri]
MTFFSQLQSWCMKNRLLVIICCLLAITFVTIILRQMPSDSESLQSSPLIQENNKNQSLTNTKPTNTSSTNQPPTAIVVDIKGAVKHPNTYQMLSDDRIKQLLDKAEVLPTADLSQINLAEKLSDQKMIYIPQKGEQPKTTSASMVTSTGSSSSSNGGITTNLNTAQLNDLTNIPGIGPAKAQAIIAYREEKGRFQSVEELKQVKGIGEKTFENISSYFSV